MNSRADAHLVIIESFFVLMENSSRNRNLMEVCTLSSQILLNLLYLATRTPISTLLHTIFEAKVKSSSISMLIVDSQSLRNRGAAEETLRYATASLTGSQGFSAFGQLKLAQ
jgi:hypothetical protein